jgi:Endonuclease-reverse transcriptase
MDFLRACGDFNVPGVNASSVDGRLASLLDTHGYEQHVTVPTRRSSRSDNLLDLLISSSSTSPQQLISKVEVRSSHHLSDHDLVLCDLSAWRHKPPAV